MTLLEQIAEWHEIDEHKKIVEPICALSPESWGYRLTCLPARALNNLDREDDGLRLLLSVETEGQDDALWHFRIGYSLSYLGQYGASAPCSAASWRWATRKSLQSNCSPWRRLIQIKMTDKSFAHNRRLTP
ncbi:MAG: hypothetical protein LBJ12_04130 [Oscillospiraceae bacterium]|jgi:hypothetical protein|nr:hypothetical protein [Oscillospiraceae bacterium]